MEREPAARDPRRSGRRLSPGPALVLAALPWSWFLLRDALGLVGDVLAIVLPVLAGLAAVVAVLVWRRQGVLPAVSVVLAATAMVVLPWTPDDAGEVGAASAVTVASANVTGRSSTLPALRDVSADVLVVVENDRRIDAALAATRPFHLFAPGAPSVGVYSRLPVRLLEPPGPDLAGIRVRVDAPAPFVLYALHVPRPWWTGDGGYQATPAEHHRLVTAVAGRIDRETDPVVVAGDLNSTDRARDYRLLVDGTGLTDAMRDGWTGPTSVTKWQPFLLRIDHLLVGPGWCGDAARRFALPGSDHDGVTATVGPCGAAPPGG